LSNTKEDLERTGIHLAKLAKEKEELTKDKAQLMVEKSSAERSNRTLSEELAVLKSDKESLETGLYEQQQIGNQLEAKKTSLEQDIQVSLQQLLTINIL